MFTKEIAIHTGIGVLSTAIVSWLDIRPYGILFIFGLMAWLCTVFCPGNIRFENAKPLQDILRGNVASFTKLRREKPAVFCFIASVALFMLMILGHILSGTWLVIGGLTVVGLISSRHNIRIVRAPSTSSDEPKVMTGETQASSYTTVEETTKVAADDEFLPEVNESAMLVLNRASNDAVMTKSTPDDDEKSDSDSIQVEMLMPEDSLPDIEHDDSEDEFKPRLIMSKKDPSPFSLGTSDEDDEDSLSKGLNFHGYNVVDHKSSQRGAVVESSDKNKQSPSTNLTSLVSNMIPWNMVGNLIAANAGGIAEAMAKKQPEKRPSVDSSDESEFEMLNPDELNQMDS